MPYALLPIELIEIIIDHLAHGSSSAFRADLKNCALVCWSFLPICRKHLFAQMFISTHPRPHFQYQTMENLVTLLRSSPEVAYYTRELYLCLARRFKPLPTELKLFSRLRLYSLSPGQEGRDSRQYYDFEGIPTQTKEILLHPMPTLETFRLDAIANFPFYELLRCCPKIRHLELSNEVDGDNILMLPPVLPHKPIKLESFCSGSDSHCQAVAIKKILKLRQSDGRPVINISGLKHLDLACTGSPAWSTLRTMFLQETNRLVTIALTSDTADDMFPPTETFHLGGLGKLLLPSIKNLKEITISVDIKGPEQDPFCGLCEELEVLGNQPNVLETLYYELILYPGFRCSTGDEWGKFDQVIDRFTWPMLKKIKLYICLGIKDRPNSEIADFRRRLDALPEKQLPKLFTKSRTDLDFQFSVG